MTMPRPPLAKVTLEGESVRLEPLSLAHVAALAEIAAGDRATYGFTFVPEGYADVVAYVELANEQHAQGVALPFATIAKRSRERGGDVVVGSTRFWNADSWYPPRGDGGPDAAEIGWTWLAPHAQRSAVNTEAKLLMLTYAFETWRLHRVSLLTDERNARSRAAIARLGATFDGIIRGHMRGADGTVRNSAFFSILEPEWPSVKAGLVVRAQRHAASRIPEGES